MKGMFLMKKFLTGFLCAAVLASTTAAPVLALGPGSVTPAPKAGTVTPIFVLANQPAPAPATSGTASPTAIVAGTPAPVSETGTVTPIFVIGMPNPLVSYTSLEQLRGATGFPFGVPSSLPAGYVSKNYWLIAGKTVQIAYDNGSDRIIYRAAQGDENISGVYRVYPTVKTIAVGNAKVTVKGRGNTIHLAIWSNDGMSYSMYFSKAVNTQSLTSMINGIR